MQQEKAIPTQIEVSKHMARALQQSVQRVNSLAAAMQGAQIAYQSAAQIVNDLVVAVVRDADKDPAEFAQFDLVEEGSRVYLRPKQAQ